MHTIPHTIAIHTQKKQRNHDRGRERRESREREETL